MNAYRGARDLEVRAGDGTVIRPGNSAALAELRVVFQVARRGPRARTVPAWAAFTDLCMEHGDALLGALPSHHDPSDREETAYEAGRDGVLDDLETWLASPMPTDGSWPAAVHDLRQWVRTRRG